MKYVPADASDEEHRRIAEAINSPSDFKVLSEQSRLDSKISDGTLMFISAALATTLGLSNGRGLYLRYGSAWHPNGSPPVLTVATLTAAATAGAGARAFVTDANATTFASVVAGGGANFVPVFSDATDWRIG